MSWAPAASLMKRDCCVLAPDLRGHGLTASVPSRDHPDDDLNGDGKNDLMSLDSLAEDVTSLLVEIFSSGLLLRKPRPHQQEPSPETEDGRAEGTARACSARGSETTAQAAGAAKATAAAPPEAASSMVEVHVPHELVAEEGDDTAATTSGGARHATSEAALHGDAEKTAVAQAKAEVKTAESQASKVGVHLPQGIVAGEEDLEIIAGSGDANLATKARDSGKGGETTQLVESPSSMPKGVGGGGGGGGCKDGSGGNSGKDVGATPLVECPGSVAKEGVLSGGNDGGDTCEGGIGRKTPGAAGSGVGEASHAAPGSISGEDKGRQAIGVAYLPYTRQRRRSDADLES